MANAERNHRLHRLEPTPYLFDLTPSQATSRLKKLLSDLPRRWNHDLVEPPDECRVYLCNAPVVRVHCAYHHQIAGDGKLSTGKRERE